MFVTCKQRIEVRKKVVFSVIINFISFIIKAISSLEAQVFYYLSAGKGIISLRYVLSRVKILYLVYNFIYLLRNGYVDSISNIAGNIIIVITILYSIYSPLWAYTPRML